MADSYSVISADHKRGYPYGGTTGRERSSPALMRSEEELRHPYLGERIERIAIVNPRKDEIKKEIRDLKKRYTNLVELLRVLSDDTFNIMEKINVLYKINCGYAARNKNTIDKMIKTVKGLDGERMFEERLLLEILDYDID